MILQTIPQMLVKTRGNMSEVARLLDCQHQTVAVYARDKEAKDHAIVNGVLMTASKKKGNRS